MSREHGPECAYCDAIEMFDAWVAEHDPEGELTLLEQIEAYAASTAE